MKPNAQFLNKPLSWWADIKTISEAAGYTQATPRGQVKVDQIKIHTAEEIVRAYEGLGLSWEHLFSADGSYTPTSYGAEILAYLTYRSGALGGVKHHLMSAEEAKAEFVRLSATKAIPPEGASQRPVKAMTSQIPTLLISTPPMWSCPFPMNKQAGDKRDYAFLTCIVNMLIEQSIGRHSVNYDPRTLTAVTKDGKPLRTMSRRVDGAFPSIINPTAIWEIKEYYYTTTFGSRIADGVYETLLDGMEINEMSRAEGIKINHYLIVDAYETWWRMGKSYLCRMVDMLHMGYVDEVLFGREVLDRVPVLVGEWVAYHNKVAAISPEIDPA